jgi:hypothetical protein
MRSLLTALALLLPTGDAPGPTAALAAPDLRFTDVTARSGLGFLHMSGERYRKDYIFEAKGGGVAALDIDNDGDGTFTDVTAQAGVNVRGWSASAAFFDADDDGRLDPCFMGRSFGDSVGTQRILL